MNKIIKICLWALVFTPLVVDNSSFYSPSITENIFMRAILCLISILIVFNLFYESKFRDKIFEKVKSLIKNPLVISILAFVFLYIISAIFSIDKYSAFWGTIDREEGLVGLMYFFSFFVFSLLIFEKKDWLWFFKLSLFTSLVLVISGFVQHGSLVGNTTFLSGYLLFSIFSSIVVFSEVQNKFWQYFSIMIISISILGIFIAQTRGTIVGLAVAFVTILIYGAVKGKYIFYKKFNFRKISIIILCFLFIFSSVFFVTRKNEIWQKVPGFNRIALISSTDSTTQTRLIMAKLSLDAVNPAQNGLKKLLIGWGPENFSLAYDKYFNPLQFQYEVGWFDRAHNKLLDVLVMTGLLGLFAYLAIWFFFFKSIFKKFSLLNIGLLFFGVSLFVHLLFVFDQITTFIPFFAVLAFVVYLNNDNSEKEPASAKSYSEARKKTNLIFAYVFFSILALFLVFVFIRNDFPAYMQMREYDSLKEKGDAKIMLNNIDSIFEPFTTAQEKIRGDFLTYVSNNYDAKSESIAKLSDISFLKAEEYVKKMPFDLQFLNLLALTYTSQGKDLNNIELLNKGEAYFQKILSSVPEKPDFNYGLALNWLYQKKYNESFNLFEKVFDTTPNYFSQKDKGPEGIYTMFLKYFYEAKDLGNFIKTTKRLKENNYASSVTLDKIIEFIQKNNTWPNINFTQ